LPEEDHVTALSFLLFLPFSLCAALAGMLWESGMRAVWKYLSHYAIFLAAFLLFILLPSGASLSVPFVIITLLLFSVLWWASRGVVHILSRVTKGK
jgi:hypothetical protein